MSETEKWSKADSDAVMEFDKWLTDVENRTTGSGQICAECNHGADKHSVNFTDEIMYNPDFKMTWGCTECSKSKANHTVSLA